MPHKWESEAQRKALYAAAAGKSKLGIPQYVGKEMTEGDAKRLDACADAAKRGDIQGMMDAYMGKKK